MVIICKDEFTNDEQYIEHFQKFPFPLSDFQKYAIQSITEGNHVLVTAHTGSGKTLPAEFAIEYFIEKGKKVIYTSPIKALSNQKFYEFTKKYPNISFGILTGDIKFNPEADVLIMTTEILRNTLLQKTFDKTLHNTNASLHFEMDFENELAGVIFDEVHYINDQDRGKVWEETIMLLPSHVQLIMLSATIDKSEVFAKWIEDVKKTDEHQKKVYLAPTTHRVVPLKHYFYTTMPQGPFKNIKDKEFLKFINGFLHKPIIVKDDTTKFNKDNYENVKKLLTYIQKNDCHIKPAFVLCEITKYLNNNDMLPAICFIFSRKLVEKYANQITFSLFDEYSEIPFAIRRECEHILRKLPNHQEYFQLPEFKMIFSLLEKGIAIHHSGILPVFREMTELLFSKGYIKLLFATETFAVGINMPTKTVIFTGFDKFNGSSMRLLHPHEYTQMAGRAGRRGLDTIGHVIHLNNMFHLPSNIEYDNLLNGKPQRLISKFQISYNLVLNFIQNKCDTISFAEKSMGNGEIESTIYSVNEEIKQLKVDLGNKLSNPKYGYVVENTSYFENYIKLVDSVATAKQKTKKQIQREIETIETNKNFKIHLDEYKSIITVKNEIKENEEYIDILTNHFQTTYDNNVSFLHTHGFVIKDTPNTSNLLLEEPKKESYTEVEMDSTNKNIAITITPKGRLAVYIQETHCLAFVELLTKHNYFNDFNAYDIAAILSCFANIRVKEESKIYNPSTLTCSDKLNILLIDLKDIYENYMTIEQNIGISNSAQLSYTFELVNPILNWCESQDEITCRGIIQTCEHEYQLFTGEFIKSILKINNMANELKMIAEDIGNIELLHKLSEIPDMSLKYVATNQSLYV